MSLEHESLKMITEKERCRSGLETAVFGAGCFWCVEAIFQQLKGVIKVIPGYSGGHVKNPSYAEVCEGLTGHAEVCKIIYDADVIAYEELLEVFWLIHDPTSADRQGNDIGPQYRPVIFYRNDEQMELSLEYKSMLIASQCYTQPIVTEVVRFTDFYRAEEYHFNYFTTHQHEPYSKCVILPKIEKFRKVFQDKLKVQDSML